MGNTNKLGTRISVTLTVLHIGDARYLAVFLAVAAGHDVVYLHLDQHSRSSASHLMNTSTPYSMVIVMPSA